MVCGKSAKSALATEARSDSRQSSTERLKAPPSVLPFLARNALRSVSNLGSIEYAGNHTRADAFSSSRSRGRVGEGVDRSFNIKIVPIKCKAANPAASRLHWST